jgi:hypothetical protein
MGPAVLVKGGCEPLVAVTGRLSSGRAFPWQGHDSRRQRSVMARRFIMAAGIVAVTVCTAIVPCAAQAPAPSGGSPQGGGPQPPVPGSGLSAPGTGTTSAGNVNSGPAPAAIQSTSPPISFRLVPGTVGQAFPGMPSGPPLNAPMGAGSIRSVVISPGPCVSPTPSEATTAASGGPCEALP